MVYRLQKFIDYDGIVIYRGSEGFSAYKYQKGFYLMLELKIHEHLICTFDDSEQRKMSTAVDRLNNMNCSTVSTMKYMSGLLEVQDATKFIYIDDDGKIAITEDVELVINRLFVFKLPDKTTGTTALRKKDNELFAVPTSMIIELSLHDEYDLDTYCIQPVACIPDFYKGEMTQGYWTIP